MPHLRFRAVEPHIVKTLITPLLDELSTLLKASRSAFSFELINTQYFSEVEVYPNPMVEILWFAREQDIQNQVAKSITNQMQLLLGVDVSIAVVFIPMLRSDYYLDGKHF